MASDYSTVKKSVSTNKNKFTFNEIKEREVKNHLR